MTTYEYIAFTKGESGISSTYPPMKELLDEYKKFHPLGERPDHPQYVINWLGRRGWRLVQILQNGTSQVWSYWFERISERRCASCEQAIQEMDAADAMVGAS